MFVWDLWRWEDCLGLGGYCGDSASLCRYRHLEETAHLANRPAPERRPVGCQEFSRVGPVKVAVGENEFRMLERPLKPRAHEAEFASSREVGARAVEAYI